MRNIDEVYTVQQLYVPVHTTGRDENTYTMKHNKACKHQFSRYKISQYIR